MTDEQEQALRDYLQEAIIPLIEQVLVKKLGQAMSFAAEQKLVAPQRTWVGLTDEDLSVCDEDGVILARYWEAKLKEKNT